ncbi:Cytochrome b5 isoform E [Glycine soja]|uniref:Cytochrome b5 isoform E isoform B n=1 Tax=Glycine soja TaxID=3848 RepID=A0A445GD46_GLYSO|nr:Cytochrome b5 isoform E isoform B [Glycine soja]
MGSKTKTFTFEEVAKHNHRKDCWIIVKGKCKSPRVYSPQFPNNWYQSQVYDVTPFLDDHPGGDEVLVTATEKDATTDFEDIGHSDSATQMMEKYFVGEVDTNTLPAQVTSNNSVRQPTQAPPAYNNQSSGFVVKMLQYIVPLLILAFAFGLQYYGKKNKSTESEN